MMNWATRSRPNSGAVSAYALPPPSPIPMTSGASTFSSPDMSPSSRAAKNRLATSSLCARDASKRGRPCSAIRRRARARIWRQFCSDLPVISAISPYP